MCKIYDFGIENMDYCIVMECGTLNLAEWRSKTFGKFLMNSEEIILLLLIYYDILLIIETIHAADIVHFDIKCCNFVLRNEALSVEHMKVFFHLKPVDRLVLFLSFHSFVLFHI